MSHLPEKEDTERLWRGTGGKQIKLRLEEVREDKKVTGGDNINKGASAQGHSGLRLAGCCFYNHRRAKLCVTSDLEEGHGGSSVHGAVLYGCLIGQVVHRLYGHLHPLDCQEGSQVGSVG